MASHSSAAPVVTSASGALFATRPGEITQAPTRLQSLVCATFRRLSFLFSCSTILLVTFIVLRIAISAYPAMRQQGSGFSLRAGLGRERRPVRNCRRDLGNAVIPPFSPWHSAPHSDWPRRSSSAKATWGRRSSASCAFSIFTCIPSGQKVPDQIEDLLKQLIELLAAIPSVVYGLWGLFVVIPLIRPFCHLLTKNWVGSALFSTDLSGPGVLPAVIVLAIMILPTITAISRDALTSVPPKLRMAAYGLGATRWETIIGVILPTASRGIFGGMVLAFGRALGETMALAMLVGNSNRISLSLFSPANTLAALLANHFPEAGPKEVGILMYAALVLLGITLIVNIFGAFILQRASRSAAE